MDGWHIGAGPVVAKLLTRVAQLSTLYQLQDPRLDLGLNPKTGATCLHGSRESVLFDLLVDVRSCDTGHGHHLFQSKQSKRLWRRFVWLSRGGRLIECLAGQCSHES